MTVSTAYTLTSVFDFQNASQNLVHIFEYVSDVLPNSQHVIQNLVC